MTCPKTSRTSQQPDADFSNKFCCNIPTPKEPHQALSTYRILLANPLQSSSSTFSCVCFPSLFAFKEGMWDTHISALLNSPTVAGRFLNDHGTKNFGP